ncbi:MAG: hypothetical protein Phog2KO_07960 [Phototrophicaceae bacterium]
MEEVTLSIAFIAGLLSFLSPCVLPLVPAYVSYMGGRAVHQVASGGSDTKGKYATRSRLTILTHGLAFVLGFTVVFVTLGIATTAFVQLLGASAAIITEIIARVGGLIIIVFGLHFMGALRHFFAWLRKNPDYLERVPTVYVALIATSLGVIFIIAQFVLMLPFGSLLTRMLILVALMLVLIYSLTKISLSALPKPSATIIDALGSIPTTILITLIGIALIVWSFVEIIVAIPVAAIFFVVLFVGGAFNKPRDYWLNVITSIETALYTDTRRDMNPTGSSSLSGSFIMGVTFSAGWTPCIGPIYGAILQLGLQGEVFAAAPLLLMYSLGLGIPFLITAGLLDGAQVILRRIQRYMGKIELFTGVLLIFVGLLVASGQLQSLSQNLSPEQTAFSINIEECGTSVAQGNIAFGQFGDCMNDTLHPVALNQGVSDEFDEENTVITYAIRIDEPETIDIDISRIEDSFPAIVTVLDSDGNEIASSDEIVAVDERSYRILENVSLSQIGRYTVVATRTDNATSEFQFRLTIRRDTNDVDIESSDNAEAVDISTVGSIEGLASVSDAPIGLDVGNRAPEFEVTTIAGDTLSLSDLQGQVVLVNFWGTWCGPCIREMPDLQEVYDANVDNGFTILALATRGDTEADVIEFRDEYELTFPLIVDEGDIITDNYGIVNRPSTFIIDQEGVIVFRHFGPVVESQITELLAELDKS